MRRLSRLLESKRIFEGPRVCFNGWAGIEAGMDAQGAFAGFAVAYDLAVE
jgi:hypothetical protein